MSIKSLYHIFMSISTVWLIFTYCSVKCHRAPIGHPSLIIDLPITNRAPSLKAYSKMIISVVVDIDKKHECAVSIM